MCDLVIQIGYRPALGAHEVTTLLKLGQARLPGRQVTRDILGLGGERRRRQTQPKLRRGRRRKRRREQIQLARASNATRH